MLQAILDSSLTLLNVDQRAILFVSLLFLLHERVLRFLYERGNEMESGLAHRDLVKDFQ